LKKRQGIPAEKLLASLAMGGSSMGTKKRKSAPGEKGPGADGATQEKMKLKTDAEPGKDMYRKHGKSQRILGPPREGDKPCKKLYWRRGAWGGPY